MSVPHGGFRSNPETSTHNSAALEFVKAISPLDRSALGQPEANKRTAKGKNLYCRDIGKLLTTTPSSHRQYLRGILNLSYSEYCLWRRPGDTKQVDKNTSPC